jgi:hypothetical protein
MMLYALCGCRGRGGGILRVVEQLQVKKFEAKDHIRRDRGFAAGARDPCRSPRASRRGDRSARRIGCGPRARELDVTPATGHVAMNPVVCITNATARRRKWRADLSTRQQVARKPLMRAIASGVVPGRISKATLFAVITLI